MEKSTSYRSPHIAEQRGWEVAEGFPAHRILCTTLSRAQLAYQRAKRAVETASESQRGEQKQLDLRINAWFIDQYQMHKVREYGVEHYSDAVRRIVQLECLPDPAEEKVDLAIVPLHTHGEAEFSRDTLQLMHQRLSSGGTLVASVDNPRDRWLHEQMRDIFSKVTVHTFPDAMVYSAIKQTELKKVKKFECEFAFRDQDKLIYAISRPGVFSHRHIDPGARQLLDTVQVGPKSRVIDIGCGAGTVALALAARDPSLFVHAVDGNARAVQCTEAGALRNALTNVKVELNAHGTAASKESFDLAVANPPYFADFRIAEHFVETAKKALKPGGQLLLVTKQPQWYEGYMPDRWDDVDIWPSKRYHLVAAIKP